MVQDGVEDLDGMTIFGLVKLTFVELELLAREEELLKKEEMLDIDEDDVCFRLCTFN